MGTSVETITILMMFVSFWALAWKGVALWKAAKQKSLVWFIILLIINDFGILEILYIFWFSKIAKKPIQAGKPQAKKKKR